MPRRVKRYTGRGDLHFIAFSCYERRPFLQSKRVKNTFVKILEEVRGRFGFRLMGYVLMPEHVHLLIDELPKALPARVIQVLKQRVSRILRGGGNGVRPGNLLCVSRRIWRITGGSGSGDTSISTSIGKRSCERNSITCMRIR